MLDIDGRTIPMDQIQDKDANLYFGHYAIDLEAGWFAIEDTQSGEGFFVGKCWNLPARGRIFQISRNCEPQRGKDQPRS